MTLIIGMIIGGLISVLIFRFYKSDDLSESERKREQRERCVKYIAEFGQSRMQSIVDSADELFNYIENGKEEQ